MARPRTKETILVVHPDTKIVQLDPDDGLISMTEAARWMGRTPATVREWISRGRLRGYKFPARRGMDGQPVKNNPLYLSKNEVRGLIAACRLHTIHPSRGDLFDFIARYPVNPTTFASLWDD